MQEKEYKVSGKTATTILIVLGLLQMIDWADRAILTIALPKIKQQFALTDAQAGMLPSLLTLGIAIFTIPASMFSDRLARRKIIAIMSLVWSTFTLVTGLATYLWHLLLARFMVGAGEAGYAQAGQTWLGVIFPKEKRSQVLGVFTAFNPIGISVGLFAGGLLISATNNWKVPFYVFGIPGLLLAALVYSLPDYKVKKEGESLFSKSYFKDWGSVFKIKSFWFNVASMIFINFGVYAMMAWMPSLVIRAYKMDTGAVGMTLGLLGLIYVVGPLGGLLADKWWQRNKNGRPYYVAISTLFYVVISIVIWLTVGISFGVWIGLYAILSIIMALTQPVSQTLIHDITPVNVRSTSIGTQALFAQFFGATLGPIFVGAISDARGGGVQGLQIGLLWASLVPLLGVITLLIMTRYYPADNAKVSDRVLAER